MGTQKVTKGANAAGQLIFDHQHSASAGASSAQYQNVVRCAMRVGAAAMQLIKLVEKKHQRVQQRRFEKWKFFYLGNREGFHVITQMKHFEMMYSDSDKGMTPVDSGA